MALVTQKTYMAWYLEDSWMYKQFSYVFINPLWKTSSIPPGFSLCPYAWTSIIIGFLFLRLFFVPTMLAVGKILHVVPFGERCYRKVISFILRKIGIDDIAEEIESKPGSGLLVTMIVIIGSLCLIAVGHGIYLIVSLIPSLYNWWTNGIIYDQWNAVLPIYIVIGIPLSIGCAIYVKHKQEKGEEPCPAWIYVKLLLLAFILHCCYYLTPSVISLSNKLYRFTVDYIISSIVNCSIICFNTLIDVIVYICQWVIGPESYTGLPRIATFVLGWIVVLFIGYILNKLGSVYLKYQNNKYELYVEQINEKTITRSDWVDLIVTYVMFDKFNNIYTSINNYINDFCENKNIESPYLEKQQHYMLRELVEIIVDKFIVIPDRLECMTYKEYIDLKQLILKSRSKIRSLEICIADINTHLHSPVHELGLKLHYTLNCIDNDNDYNDKNIMKIAKKYLNDTYLSIKELAEIQYAQYQIKLKQQKERSIKLDKMCKTSTGLCLMIWSNVIVNPIVTIFSGIRQCLSYMFALLKAYKQKACPYVKFYNKNDIVEENTVKESSK